MLVDGGTSVKLMPYSMFKKFGREDDELVKTNLTLNDMGGGPNGGQRHCLHGAHRREQVVCYHVLCRRGVRKL
jgi:hypothetical protein